MLLKIGLLAVLVLQSLPAIANDAEWKQMGSGPLSGGARDPYRGTQVVAVHVPSLKRKGQIVDYWLQKTPTPAVRISGVAEPVVMSKDKRQVNCDSGEQRVLTGTFYHASQATTTYPEGISQWRSPPPDSTDAAVGQFVCKQTASALSRILGR